MDAPSPTLNLRAQWLDSWQAPRDLARGRRWGDLPWALLALSQAWILGGREGCWPLARWEARRPRGPWIKEILEVGRRAPPEESWIALLRHGSAEAPARERNRREGELAAACWEALLAGNGAPWMAYASILLDGPSRVRTIPAIAAVRDGTHLILPPWAELLVPACWRILPDGWWPALLGSMDASGRLLPEAPFPSGATWAPLLAERPGLLLPLILPGLPPELQSHHDSDWIHALPDGTWMIDPRVRAWARGYGFCLEGLDGIRPWNPGHGFEPAPGIQSLLQGRMPQALPALGGWAASLEADLNTVHPRPDPPPPSGDPTWDRLRVRWGGNLPAPCDGYPEWGVRVHPCADPFHWMAEGERAFHGSDLEGAQWAFAWAHGHFERLGAPFWARRAAANTALAALPWGDLRAAKAWQALAQEPLAHLREMDQIFLMVMRTEWEEALPRLERLIDAHPELDSAWITLLEAGMAMNRPELVTRALPHIHHPIRELGEAWMDDRLGPMPAGLDPELSLMWEHYRSRRGRIPEATFWTTWKACPAALLRLEAGLSRLEQEPREAHADRLLELQVIADRADSPRHQVRLQQLWPHPAVIPETDPRNLLQAWLNRRPAPTWVVWSTERGVERLGCLEPPPEGALSRMTRDGALAPFRASRWIWVGFPLLWEGAPVGAVLQAFDPASPLDGPFEAALLAPWVARLAERPAPDVAVEPGTLLTDGTEPMASVLKELDRVAPSELTVLILGPTGSGKELAARELHARSGRPGPLVAVNCSAFAESLLESELFGHQKGAFTGADRDRAGAIESAEGGTLFLDEVADLSPRIQSMFLRVLQEREVRRVGSDRARKVDVRFVAATHKALEDLAATGSFRRDLLYRLQGTVLKLPALRERRHEFPYLLPRLVAQLAAQSRRPCPDLAPGLARTLARLPWPGNFRELRHALERALLRCGEGLLKAEHFPELDAEIPRDRTWIDATRDFQRRLLRDHLQRHRFQATETARTLGLTRPALYLAARRVGLDLVAERTRWEADQADSAPQA